MMALSHPSQAWNPRASVNKCKRPKEMEAPVESAASGTLRPYLTFVAYVCDESLATYVCDKGFVAYVCDKSV